MKSEETRQRERERVREGKGSEGKRVERRTSFVDAKEKSEMKR